MATKITLNLPDNLYERAEQFARLHQQSMDEAVSALLEQALTAGEGEEEIVDWTESDPAVTRERDAYVAMHPKLKEQYLGKYVAIYHGVLVDHDDDAAALSIRIDERFSKEFVLRTQVKSEPIQTFVIRSPRIVRDKVR